MEKTICLKIDVDTYTGTARGVPVLLEILKQYSLSATFFITFGPDNSGKAVKNIFTQKGFFKKMMATKAWKLYGIKTLFSGTLFPAPVIGKSCREILKRIQAEGHETAVHAWDHRLWQNTLDTMPEAAIQEQFEKAFEAYRGIYGAPPHAVAAPGWYCTKESLSVQDAYYLDYASDMRGDEPCYPVIGGHRFKTFQIPTTVPCIEELIALRACADHQIPQELYKKLKENSLNIVPIHAEVEGGIYQEQFKSFLALCLKSGYSFITIKVAAGSINKTNVPERKVSYIQLPSRSGYVTII